MVKAATGEVVDEETLGGGEMHTAVSGVADYLAQNDGHAIRLAREAVRDLGEATVKWNVSSEIPSLRGTSARMAR